jgi:hypothetical protein
MVTSTLLVAMVLVILAQVVFRRALNLSLAWTEEVGRTALRVPVRASLLSDGPAFRLRIAGQCAAAARGRWVLLGVDVASPRSAWCCDRVLRPDRGRHGLVTPATLASRAPAFLLSALLTLVRRDALRARWLAEG